MSNFAHYLTKYQLICVLVLDPRSSNEVLKRILNLSNSQTGTCHSLCSYSSAMLYIPGWASSLSAPFLPPECVAIPGLLPLLGQCTAADGPGHLSHISNPNVDSTLKMLTEKSTALKESGKHGLPLKNLYLTLTVVVFRCGICMTLDLRSTDQPLHCNSEAESSKVAELFNFHFILLQFLNSFEAKVVLIARGWS